MTDMTGEDWLDLEIDEGAEVFFSILAMNYDFFFQNLRPIIAAFLGILQRKASALTTNP